MFRKCCADRSIQIAKELFPQDYKNRKKYRTFHYAFGFIGRKLVGIGINQPNIPDAKALYFGRRFNVGQFVKFPFLHAEIDCISKFINKHNTSKIDLYCLRLSKDIKGNIKLANSKPCKNCQEIINALSIDSYYFDLDNCILKSN